MQAAQLVGPTRYGGSTIVPGKGWVIFIYEEKRVKGKEQEEYRMQILDHPNGQWKPGPLLYKNEFNYAQCVVQVGLYL